MVKESFKYLVNQGTFKIYRDRNKAGKVCFFSHKVQFYASSMQIENGISRALCSSVKLRHIVGQNVDLDKV